MSVNPNNKNIGQVLSEYNKHRLSRTPEQINNEINYDNFLNKLRNQIENLTNSNYSEINKKLKKHYSNYYNNKLTKDKSIHEHAIQIQKKYKNNKKVSRNLLRNIAPRNVQKFKQDIYMNELQEVIQFLCYNIDNLELFPDFLSIVLFVAKKRKIIEYLKFKKDWKLFGSLRKSKYVNSMKTEFQSNISNSSGQHLINNGNIQISQIKYNNNNLTEIRKYNNHPVWIHTNADIIIKLLYKMNKLYKKFKKSLVNKNNSGKPENLLCELYWLFIQTCPFERGSAAIAEIIFSALLQKHFGCNFKLLTEPYNPRHIPDIHALTYPLEKFKVFFWEKLVSKINNSGNELKSKKSRTNSN
jgi:hypothetical protein